MEGTAEKRFSRVLAAAAADPEYRRLRLECEKLDPAFLAVLEKLPEQDRRIVTDYIEALGASALRMTELLCEEA